GFPPGQRAQPRVFWLPGGRSVTNISGHIIVDCSADDCARHLDAYVAQRRASAEHSVRLEIGVPVADLALRRNVVATLVPRLASAGVTDRDVLYDLGWAPVEGGPYPAFSGTLTLTAADAE